MGALVAALPRVRIAVVISAILASASARAEGLETEALLHPLDGFTAYTLKQGELVYCQSPLTLPLPSWAWVGVTDWLTAEVDLLPLIGGFFVEPHRPVPSFNFRFRLRDGGVRGISLALETMWQHLWLPTTQEDSPHVRVERDGSQVWARLNVSIPVTPAFRIHASAGATYAHSFEVTDNDPEMPRGRRYIDKVSPDASLALDYRFRPWMSWHATASMGVTFVYSDNQPRKLEAGYGMRIAPFLHSSYGILSNLRAELAAFVTHHPASGTGYFLPVPIFPYLYWQWNND